jgi:hypothetical protein
LVVGNSCLFGWRESLSWRTARKAGTTQPRKKSAHEATKQMLRIPEGNASMTFAIPPNHVSRSITFSPTTNKIMPSQSALAAARIYPFFCVLITVAFLNADWRTTND